MRKKTIIAVIITLTVTALLILSSPVSAKQNSGNQNEPFGYAYRPGWGFGDVNHIHTGPPGK